MKKIKHPWETVVAVVLGLMAVLLAGLVIAGRIGFALFFYWLCAIGSVWMFWVAYRVPRIWPEDKRELADETAKWLRYVAYFLLILAGLSLFAHFNS